jgi:hypothetical protein
VAKKTADADRKARVEEMRRAQEATERRRNLLVGGAVAIVLVLLVGTVFAVVRNYQKAQNPASVGLSATAAGCDAPTDDPATGGSVHVGPGTDKADTIKVKYATVPPSSGEHYVQPDTSGTKFFTVQSRPKMETLVHNLEHGYTVLWYTSAVPPAQLDELRKITELSNKDPAAKDKFLVSAWDDGYGSFPAGKTIGMSHWSAKSKAHRQLCGQVSGAAVKAFISKYPASDAPEAGAA